MSDDLKELKAKLAAAEAERDRLAMTPALDAAIAATGVKPQFRKAVLALFLSRRDLELDGRDVLCGGLPIEAAVRTWATGEGQAFLAPAGALPTSKRRPGAPAKKRSEMTNAEKGAYIGAHGLDAYEALPR